MHGLGFTESFHIYQYNIHYYHLKHDIYIRNMYNRYATDI